MTRSKVCHPVSRKQRTIKIERINDKKKHDTVNVSDSGSVWPDVLVTFKTRSSMYTIYAGVYRRAGYRL